MVTCPMVQAYSSNFNPAKSDAKRPCSTCVRSHAHAVAHAPPGTSLPPKPECTFDDGLCTDFYDEYFFNSGVLVPESTTSVSEGPRSRHEKLENRIRASMKPQ